MPATASASATAQFPDKVYGLEIAAVVGLRFWCGAPVVCMSMFVSILVGDSVPGCVEIPRGVRYYAPSRNA